ncbi:urease accessory protein UreF [Methylophaga sp.]|uniref:urease accessory protein UreF n=1 Tax=Methylophaga sp. TaxID=2024840 RepID=UPI003F6A3C86
MNNSAALSRLLQLASPTLPIGAYSYSQGLEWAIESNDVKDVDTAKAWMSEVMHLYLGQFDLPVIKRLFNAWEILDEKAIFFWDARYTAGRDSAETLLESRQMGYSLLSLQRDLDSFSEARLALAESLHEPAFPTIYSVSAVSWEIGLEETLHAYLWSWLENQVSAAMKTVPLGQVAGQRILTQVSESIPAVVKAAMTLPDDEINNFCPALTIASCQHETQYTRLFRS